MNGLERFEALARLAAAEPAPLPDVTAAVRANLHRTSAPLPWAWAFACCSIALVASLVGYQSWAALSNPWLTAMVSLSGGWLL